MIKWYNLIKIGCGKLKHIKVMITTLVIICMIFLTSGCGKNENELVLVTEAGFAPYEYYEEGKIVGVDIDIAYEIAKELGKELVIKDVSFDFVIN